jgi:hypothetical protein
VRAHHQLHDAWATQIERKEDRPSIHTSEILSKLTQSLREVKAVILKQVYHNKHTCHQECF